MKENIHQKLVELKRFLRSKGFTYHATGKVEFDSPNEKGVSHEVDVLSSHRGDYLIIKYKDSFGEVYAFNVLSSYRPKKKSVQNFDEVMADLERELADVPTVKGNIK